MRVSPDRGIITITIIITDVIIVRIRTPLRYNYLQSAGAEVVIARHEERAAPYLTHDGAGVSGRVERRHLVVTVGRGV